MTHGFVNPGEKAWSKILTPIWLNLFNKKNITLVLPLKSVPLHTQTRLLVDLGLNMRHPSSIASNQCSSYKYQYRVLQCVCFLYQWWKYIQIQVNIIWVLSYLSILNRGHVLFLPICCSWCVGKVPEQRLRLAAVSILTPYEESSSMLRAAESC